jgi:hypothetical protein
LWQVFGNPNSVFSPLSLIACDTLMDCKVKEHYQYTNFSLAAINISTVFIQTSIKLITQSACSIIRLHILHIPSLKQYTSIAHFTVHLLYVLSLKQIISLHDITSTELVPSVKYIPIRFLQNNFNFQLISLSPWSYIFQVL